MLLAEDLRNPRYHATTGSLTSLPTKTLQYSTTFFLMLTGIRKAGLEQIRQGEDEEDGTDHRDEGTHVNGLGEEEEISK